jgi:hypothetical protein
MAGSPLNPYQTSAIVLKYDKDGNQLWVGRYDNPAKGHDIAIAIALDGDDNVCVTGYSSYRKPGQVGDELLTMKFDQHTPRLAPRGFFFNQQFHDCLASEIGALFQVQSSTTRWDWMPLAKLTNYNGLVPFVDPSSTKHSLKFYRAVPVGP